MKVALSLLVPVFAALVGCTRDESISSFVPSDAEFTLVSLDGAPFDARATIAFPEPGQVVGQAPCNRYFGAQSVPYPWFAVESIGATRMACPDLPAEGAFFDALSDMTLAEVAGDTLILSNPGGRTMVFERR